ncbi:MAG: precorrin-3B C(17)-methyltransferase [Nitrospirae bacterium]|nr:MAG: precorrin-3B C(17)-methyltransferase [Nitrospirota bacterium]
MIKTSSMGIEKGHKKMGKLSIVGIGPGDLRLLTEKAKRAIEEADVLVGYKVYIDLIEPIIREKRIISTGMRGEIERCKRAISLAIGGDNVVVISSGDPGIYAMAGLIFELINKNNIIPHIEVIPGISALNAAASKLGAPIMHDFATISLSDLLTPWHIIEKRIEAAASADFVIVIYNPKSKKREKQIVEAVNIISRYRSGNTPVGIVRNAYRDDESIVITNLKEMLGHPIDMLCTIIIGNSKTFVYKNWIVTPRGYDSKYNLH